MNNEVIVSKALKSVSYEERRRSYLLPVVVVGIVGAVISLFLYITTVEWGEDQQQRAFVTAADDRISSLNTRMGYKLHQLHSLAVFFESSRYVSAEEFNQFVSHLRTDNETGVTYIWTPYLKHQKREVFEHLGRTPGKTGFEITEMQDKQVVRAADRPNYFPIQYMQPEQKSGMDIGYDLASNSDIQIALDAAHSELLPRMAIIESAHDRSSEIAMFMPVFHGMKTQNIQQRLQGFVIEEFSPKAVLAERDRKSTRLNSSHITNSYVVFCLKKKQKKKQKIQT